MSFDHILILCEDKDLSLKIGKDLWEKNKNWCVVTVTNCFDDEYKRFLKRYKTISLNDTNCWKDKKVNDFIKYCTKRKILPIFVTIKKDLEKSFAHLMYSNIEEIFLDSMDYIHDEKDSNTYQEFLKIVGHYLW